MRDNGSEEFFPGAAAVKKESLTGLHEGGRVEAKTIHDSFDPVPNLLSWLLI